MAVHAAAEAERQERLSQARQEHEKQAAELAAALAAHNSEVDSLESDYKAGTSDAIMSYCELVLDEVPTPATSPRVPPRLRSRVEAAGH